MFFYVWVGWGDEMGWIGGERGRNGGMLLNGEEGKEGEGKGVYGNTLLASHPV